MLLNQGLITAAISISLFLASCKFFNGSSDCTDALYTNVCVKGKYNDWDSGILIRERANGYKDTLTISSDTSQLQNYCFPELGDRQRIVVYQNEIRIDSSARFNQEKLDGCRYKDVIIVF